MVWNCAASNLGESGDVGRTDGEERGDGILGEAEGRVRVGETPLAGAAVLRTWVGAPEKMLVFVIRQEWRWWQDMASYTAHRAVRGFSLEMSQRNSGKYSETGEVGSGVVQKSC